jgi:hypothetical protein
LCISLGPDHSVGDVSRTVMILASLYDRSRPYRLVFGGTPAGSPPAGYLDGPFESVGILDSCAELAAMVDVTRSEPTGAR